MGSRVVHGGVSRTAAANAGEVTPGEKKVRIYDDERETSHTPHRGRPGKDSPKVVGATVVPGTEPVTVAKDWLGVGWIGGEVRNVEVGHGVDGERLR